MTWNGSGVFSRTNGVNTGSETWQDDAAASTKIRADRHDTHDQDLSDGIDACITQDNQSKPTADFLPNADATYDLGGASNQWLDVYWSGACYGSACTLTAKVDTSTSAGSYTISGIPSWAKKLTLNFRAVGVDSTGHLGIRIGDATSVENTAYSGSSFLVGTGNVGSTTEWPIYAPGASLNLHGSVTITLQEKISNTWVCSGTLALGANGMIILAGRKSLTGTLTRVQLMTPGADVFDSGDISLIYE